MRIVHYCGLASALLLVTACAPEEDAAGLEGAGDDQELGEVEQALKTWRADQIAEIVLPGEAAWGYWRQAVYCNEGSWAIGFSQKVESGQGSGDDTTANAVKLACADANGTILEEVESHPGWYGAYGNRPLCGSGFVRGGRMKVEGPQGSGDDTAVNGVNMSCSSGATIGASNDGPYGGAYKEWVTCPDATRVCGLALKLEDKQGSGDDAAMTGLKLFCCSF